MMHTSLTMTRFLSSILLCLAVAMAGVMHAQDDNKYGETPEQQAACTRKPGWRDLLQAEELRRRLPLQGECM